MGNVVGSNIFNLLGVLGVSALAAAMGQAVAPAVLSFDLPVMIGVAVACLPVFFTGNRIDHWEGLVFRGYYGAYTVYLILRATERDALAPFSLAMGAFVLPLTVVTLALFIYRHWRVSRGEA